MAGTRTTIADHDHWRLSTGGNKNNYRKNSNLDSFTIGFLKPSLITLYLNITFLSLQYTWSPTSSSGASDDSGAAAHRLRGACVAISFVSRSRGAPFTVRRRGLFSVCVSVTRAQVLCKALKSSFMWRTIVCSSIHVTTSRVSQLLLFCFRRNINWAPSFLHICQAYHAVTSFQTILDWFFYITIGSQEKSSP